MAESIDQLFVTLKHALVGVLPGNVQPYASALVSIGALLGTFALLFGLVTVIERKLIGRMQNRLGPNRVGPFGFLQFAADGIKALTKEDIVPQAADRVVHFLAPIVLLFCVLMTLGVLPVGRNMALLDFDAGLLYFLAAGAATELAVFMAGWSSRNKYSLLGALRAIAQMLSYEVPLLLAVLPPVMMAGSLSLVRIVEAQSGFTGWLPHWHLLTPWGAVGLGLFLVAANAEMNRSPFDLPEGESEIVAGYFVEYSGFKFALFFMAEYLGLLAMAGLAVTLFLGGWAAPLPLLTWVPSWAWFFAKLMTLVMLFIWVRGTMPRLRMDQLMNFAWTFLVPLALVNLVATGLWHFLPTGAVRWVVCLALVGGAYVLLGRGRGSGGKQVKRVYRYAE
jgi:NADH-quinone oxidoreductase subunit H